MPATVALDGDRYQSVASNDRTSWIGRCRLLLSSFSPFMTGCPRTHSRAVQLFPLSIFDFFRRRRLQPSPDRLEAPVDLDVLRPPPPLPPLAIPWQGRLSWRGLAQWCQISVLHDARGTLWLRHLCSWQLQAQVSGGEHIPPIRPVCQRHAPCTTMPFNLLLAGLSLDGMQSRYFPETTTPKPGPTGTD